MIENLLHYLDMCQVLNSATITRMLYHVTADDTTICHTNVTVESHLCAGYFSLLSYVSGFYWY
mgnify:CR=1 FL=1